MIGHLSSNFATVHFVELQEGPIATYSLETRCYGAGVLMRVLVRPGGREIISWYGPARTITTGIGE